MTRPRPATRTRARAGARVFGLAPYQVAADMLGGEGLAARERRGVARRPAPARPPAARATRAADRRRRGVAAARRRPGGARRGGHRRHRRPARRVVARCATAGAKLLLVGDPRQLAAIGPGGALADVAEHGIVLPAGRGAPVRQRLGRPGLAAAARRRRDRARRVRQARPARRRRHRRAGRGRRRPRLAGRHARRPGVAADGRHQRRRRPRVRRSCAPSWSRSAASQEHGVAAGHGASWRRRGIAAGVGDLVQARALAWHLRGFEGNTAAPITRQTYRVLATRARRRADRRPDRRPRRRRHDADDGGGAERVG